MRTRTTLLGLIICGLATTSCASVARDALVDAYAGGSDELDQAADCRSEAQALGAASETFYAENGASATSFDDLVPAYLASTPTNWVIPDGEAGAVSNLFSPVAGGPCDGIDLTVPAEDTDDSVGQVGVDAITDIRTFDCTYDLRAINVAIETYVALNDMAPSSIRDLDEFGLIEDQAQRWRVGPPQTPGGPPSVLPAPGGGCTE